jgi:hypothetical protein
MQIVAEPLRESSQLTNLIVKLPISSFSGDFGQVLSSLPQKGLVMLICCYHFLLVSGVGPNTDHTDHVGP